MTGDFTVTPIFSPNLHEARGYNRGAHVARGQFLVFLQVGRPCMHACAQLAGHTQLDAVAMQPVRAAGAHHAFSDSGVHAGCPVPRCLHAALVHWRCDM
jgi:hypothetical protein